MSNPEYAEQVIQQYLNNLTGPLTIAGANYIAFDKLSNCTAIGISAETRQALKVFAPDWPEVEFLISSSFLGNGTGPPDGRNYASISPTLTAMLSRGNVSISSAYMNDPPIINPSWLTDPADCEIAVAAIRRARAFWNSTALKPILIGEEVWPAPTVQTDEEILDFVRSTLLTIYHAAGTCSMGKADDPDAVVDSKARVVGVQGLRVVDISAFPLLPPGQPQATVYMLAEKIADNILSGR